MGVHCSPLTCEERCRMDTLCSAGHAVPELARQLGRPRETIRRKLNRIWGPRNCDCQGADRMAQERRRGRRQPRSVAGCGTCSSSAARSRSRGGCGWRAWSKSAAGGFDAGSPRIVLRAGNCSCTCGAGGASSRPAGRPEGSVRAVFQDGWTSLIARRRQRTRAGSGTGKWTRWSAKAIEATSSPLWTAIPSTLCCAAGPARPLRPVGGAVVQALEPCQTLEPTLTVDNGKQFSALRKVGEALGAVGFVATPYASWHRGLNEHTNGLLRQ